MLPIILFIMIGARLGYTDFWYWLCVGLYGYFVVVNTIINKSK